MGFRRILGRAESASAVLSAVPSKSDTHRALIAAALARGRSRLVAPLIADDSFVTAAALRALGVPIEEREGVWIVDGAPDALRGGAEIFLKESGTSYRFLLSVAALAPGITRFDGVARLRDRPISELLRALEGLGVGIQTADSGRLPLSVEGGIAGSATTLAAGRSSQFTSSLLLIGSRLPQGLELTLTPPVVSAPYVEMTVKTLAAFGVAVDQSQPLRYRVPPTEYSGREYRIEGDHSTASYAWVAAAITGQRVRLNGISLDSAHPDRRLTQLLIELGFDVSHGEQWIEVAPGPHEIRGFDIDLSDSPDLAPSVAVLALFASGPSTLRGVAHLRFKESDRLALLEQNIRRLGRSTQAGESTLEIGPPATLKAATIETGADHRISMAFALAGMRIPGLLLDNAECVAKSNPGFWKQFAALGGRFQ